MSQVNIEDVLKPEDLNFKQMSHWSFATQYVNQEKDLANNIWKITTTRRTKNGTDIGQSTVEYFIGDTTKGYKTIQDVINAIN